MTFTDVEQAAAPGGDDPFAFRRSLLHGQTTRLEFSCAASLFQRVHEEIMASGLTDVAIQFRPDDSVSFVVNGPRAQAEALAHLMEKAVEQARQESLWPKIGLPVLVQHLQETSGYEVMHYERYVPAPSLREATGITSGDGPHTRHVVVLDIDTEAVLLPSRTPGHYHLLIDAPMSWRRYRRLLKALARAGVISRDWAWASIRSGRTFIRHTLGDIR